MLFLVFPQHFKIISLLKNMNFYVLKICKKKNLRFSRILLRQHETQKQGSMFNSLAIFRFYIQTVAS